MIRVYQYKLYLNRAQAKTLERWLAVCCWVYNRALEQRIKAYKRRKESVRIFQQQTMLTGWRARIDWVRACPSNFERDGLRRVERGMAGFFRRIKQGDKPGFPRFRARQRYNSMEYLAPGVYLHGDRVRVPNMGKVRCRGRLLPEGSQRALRIIRRASGWYAQILLDDGRTTPAKVPVENAVGVDVGLSHFATLSDGSHIANPRFGAQSARKLRAHQRRMSRRKKGSHRRRKAVLVVQRQYERIADQRRNFCHQHSMALVRKYDLIAVENLNLKGLVRSRLGKNILDASWGTFARQLVVKAEDAGRQVVAVNPRGTSQECPQCGAIKPKRLSERVHRCACGLICDRDYASARVILARGLVVSGSNRPWTDPASDAAPVAHHQVGRLKRVGRHLAVG